MKRLKSQVGGDNYAQVAFNYDAAPAPNENSNENGTEEELDEQPDEPYVPHPKFFIPADIDLVRIQSNGISISHEINSMAIVFAAGNNQIACDHRENSQIYIRPGAADGNSNQS